LDTIYQIKSKRATVLFFTPFRGTKHTLTYIAEKSRLIGHRSVLL
jgi:hypothetical protein